MTNLYNDGIPGLSGGRAKSTLTAFFDSRSDAQRAIEKLKDAGVLDVWLMPGFEADREQPASSERQGFWPKLEDWLFPDDDRTVYAEGLRRGGFPVSVGVEHATYDTAHAILDGEGAIDMDERADLWRTDGWTADRDKLATAARDDVFKADASAGVATGVGRYSRSAEMASPRVRAYELTEELPDDVVDDVLPTGHQRDVSEGDRPVDDRMRQSQSIDDLRQRQSLPGSR
ncbi:hypothetical protein [Rhizobium sp. BK251]|uniref:hypothetical protein n=1 Tax=Rhizobium sp. BK251 TaxID=2512125 RepID=UPI001053F11A|nr:hypothetical protein [Rhizobium sp. BK251]TCL66363.1 hypothetical protein EV286_11174 [Rhizobium sp. BK251]